MAIEKLTDKRPDAADEQAFNATLKRMLKTPPKPHEKSTAQKPTKPDQAEKHRKND